MHYLFQAIRMLPFGMLVAFAASPSAAEVDRSPKPGGVYKLKPGTYAAKGVSCASASNADIKIYDGRGIGTAHTHACTARVLSKRRSGYGYVYKVVQSCIDTGAGPGKRFTERQTVDVPDALNFRIISQGSTSYAYCPISR